MRESLPVAAIVVLGLTQIIGYGTLYYSFSILAPDMARDFGWSAEWIFGLLSASLFVSGLVAPAAGRLMDRFGAGRVMALGSFMAGLSLALSALAPNKAWFILGLFCVELSSSLVQYGAAFSLLVQIRPVSATRSITYLTLIAGFASTLFWPVTSALHAQLDWREVYLVYAGLNLLVCLPLHAWLSTYASRAARPVETVPRQEVIGLLPQAAETTGFRLMLAGIGLQSFLISALLFHMLPVLTALGLGASAVMVSTLFGPAQVLSRFTNMMLGRNLPALQLALITSGILPLAVVILALTRPSSPGAMLFAVVFGLGSGLSSIVIGTLPLVLFGSQGYGTRQGHVTLVRLGLSAAAPFSLAALMQATGPDLVLWSLIGLGLLAFIFFLALARLGRLSMKPA